MSRQGATEFLGRAAASIAKAFQYLNKYNWQWLLTSTTGSITASADEFDLPWDFKDVYDLRITTSGRQRILKGLPRRVYDRAIMNQTDLGDILGYDLYKRGSTGVLSLHPPTSQAESYDLKYYRRMWVPCSVTVSGAEWLAGGTLLQGADIETQGDAGDIANLTLGSPITSSTNVTLGTAVPGISYTLNPPYLAAIEGGSTLGHYLLTVSGIAKDTLSAGPITVTFGGDDAVLDIPEDYENLVLAWATHHLMSGMGAPESRLSYWIQLANDEFAEARAANERFEDQDISFEYGEMSRSPYPNWIGIYR